MVSETLKTFIGSCKISLQIFFLSFFLLGIEKARAYNIEHYFAVVKYHGAYLACIFWAFLPCIFAGRSFMLYSSCISSLLMADHFSERSQLLSDIRFPLLKFF